MNNNIKVQVLIHPIIGEIRSFKDRKGVRYYQEKAVVRHFRLENVYYDRLNRISRTVIRPTVRYISATGRKAVGKMRFIREEDIFRLGAFALKRAVINDRASAANAVVMDLTEQLSLL